MSGWYDFISPSSMLQQGEILYECPVFAPEPEIDYSKLPSPALLKFRLEYRDVIVMTQSCDIQQACQPPKGEPNLHMPILLCPISGLDAVPKESQLSNLLIDRVGSMHLLQSQDAAGTNPSVDYKIIDFSTVYSVPLGVLKNWKLTKEKLIPALKSPYVELMSQRYGMKMMRVGTDDAEKVKLDALKKAWNEKKQ